MANMTKLFCALIGLTLLWMVAGCTNPVSHPPAPVVNKKDGVPLDRNANYIPKGDKPWILSDPGDRDTLDWIIEPGRTVTIQAGAEILVDGLLWIDVQGQLIAEGTPSDPIKFTTVLVDEDFGQWRGIKVHNTDASESVFRHCIFTYGAYFDIDTLSDRGVDAQNYKGMLAIQNCSPVIEHCVAFHNQNNAVFISGVNARPRVRYNIFTDNDASAVRADTTVNLNNIDVSYNCVGDNSAIPFIMGFDSTLYGFKTTVNSNLDSCDAYYNIDMLPEFVDADQNDFRLSSCSPCIDSGPAGGIDNDFDATRADQGAVIYVQGPEEIRGVLEGAEVTLNPAITYRMSCNLRVNLGQTLVIPAGTRIEATGLYNIEVFGRLLVQGTESNPVHICPCAQVNQDVWAGLIIHQVDSLARRPGPWYQPSVIQYCEFVDYQRIDVEKPGVQFTGCRFERGYFYGVRVNTESKQLRDTVSFQYCDFVRPGSVGLSAIESPLAVRNCFVTDGKGRGISIARGGINSFVTNCVVQACSTSGIVAEDFAHTTIVNNVVRDCGYYGLQFDEQARPTVLNNIIANCDRFAIFMSNSSIPFVDYCDFFNNNTLGNPNNPFGPPGVGDTLSIRNSITGNPNFAGVSDAHLGSGSPCIDSGDPRAEFNDANGSRNDMGAYGGPFGGRVGRLTLPSNRNLVAVK